MTALRRINVRRLLNFMNNSFGSTAAPVQYEHNLIERVRQDLPLSVYRTDINMKGIVADQHSRGLPIEQCLGELALAGYIVDVQQLKSWRSELDAMFCRRDRL